MATRHEIKLANVLIDPTSGSVEVQYVWNGQPFARVYTDFTTLAVNNGDIVQNDVEAARFLLYYLLTLAGSAEGIQAFIGKTLTVDVTASLQQQLSIA
jgi:hypothetical protein